MPKRKPTPDFEAMTRIAEEIEALKEAGKWDRPAFDRLLAEARVASDGVDEFLEFVLNEEDPDWES